MLLGDFKLNRANELDRSARLPTLHTHDQTPGVLRQVRHVLPREFQSSVTRINQFMRPPVSPHASDGRSVELARVNHLAHVASRSAKNTWGSSRQTPSDRLSLLFRTVPGRDCCCVGEPAQRPGLAEPGIATGRPTISRMTMEGNLETARRIPTPHVRLQRTTSRLLAHAPRAVQPEIEMLVAALSTLWLCSLRLMSLPPRLLGSSGQGRSGTSPDGACPAWSLIRQGVSLEA